MGDPPSDPPGGGRLSKRSALAPSATRPNPRPTGVAIMLAEGVLEERVLECEIKRFVRRWISIEQR